MIDLVPDDEQSTLVDAARDVLADAADRDAVALNRAVVDQGWLGIGVPEDAGGLGFGVAEQALLFRELGRHVGAPSLLERVLAVALAVAVGASELVADLMSDTRSVALAHRDAAGDLTVWENVEHGDGPDRVLVLDHDGADLVALEALAAGTRHRSVDDGYAVRRTSWSGAGSVMHGDVHVAASLSRLGLVLSAAQLAGIADAAVRASVAYAKQREQYGRAIGAFQAVKHRCSDMAVRAEAAWCMSALAALTTQARTSGALADALSARTVALDAALANAADNIQNHGAIGFTVELPAHRLVTRAHVLGALILDRAAVRACLLEADQPW